MLLLLMRRDDNNGVNLLLLRRTQRLNVFLIFLPPTHPHFEPFVVEPGVESKLPFESNAHTSFSSMPLTVRLEFVCSVRLHAFISEIRHIKTRKIARLSEMFHARAFDFIVENC